MAAITSLLKLTFVSCYYYCHIIKCLLFSSIPVVIVLVLFVFSLLLTFACVIVISQQYAFVVVAIGLAAVAIVAVLLLGENKQCTRETCTYYS